MIKLEEFLGIISQTDKLRIRKDDTDLYVGYMGNLIHHREEMEVYMQQPVKKFRAVPELTHKEWKSRGLLPPLDPEGIATQSFSDLQMTLYYTIIM